MPIVGILAFALAASILTMSDACAWQHKATGVSRDSHGRIARSPQAKQSFRKTHPCPSTGKTSGRCPGYVIDHIHALKHGGADAPYNMQWQTKEAARLKDLWE